MPGDKKSILFVGNHLFYSGQYKSVGEELAARLEQDGYSTLLVSRKLNKSARLVDMLWTILKQHKSYDLAEVDVFSGPAFLWAFLSGGLLKLLRKPFILTLHGGNLPDFSRRHSARVRRLLAGARAVTVPSRYLLEAMRPYREDLLLIPNALDLSRYPFSRRVAPAPNLIWLRAFHEIYNPRLAVDVLNRLRARFPAVRLIMVGPDKGDGSLQKTQQRAVELDLAGSVEFTGGVSKSDVSGRMNQGDIFINTTNFDNTPVSVMEAMACGLCVVSTNVGGLPYLLTDGEDTLLVPRDNPDAMAAAVACILTEPGLAGKLSLNARQKVEKLDWSYILPQWTAILNSIR